MEGEVKFVEAKAMAVFGVALGFFEFSDQSIIHCCSPYAKEGKQKGTRRGRVPSFQKRGMLRYIRMSAVTLAESIATFGRCVNTQMSLLAKS
jgi:hypothetical protein